MQFFLDQLVNGLTAGAEYALIAAGLALVFGVVQIVNFAQGEFYMLGSYLFFILQTSLGLPYIPMAMLTLIAMACFGALFYYAIVLRVLNHSWQVQLVATLAVSMLLLNLAIVLAGTTPRLTESPFSNIVLSLGDMRVSAQRIIVLFAAIASFTLLYVWLKFTKTGKAMRAISQNREAAEVSGIPVKKVGLYAVVAASLLAGVGSVTISPLYSLQPTMGTLLIIKAFAAVIMGGFGNVTGTILSALFLGVVEAFGVGFVSSDYADVIVFAVMIAVLMFKPHGLFGKVARA